MKSVAIIPLRKGSKGIPGKNKKNIMGRSLYQWILGEAILSELDQVVVFTDDEEIISFVEKEYGCLDKVITIKRSEETATDTASTESAMIELAEKLDYDFDVFCLLQATSPLTSSTDINACLHKVKNEAYDSALSVVETKRFIWNKQGEPLNYNVFERPRRQDFSGMLVENGAVYATSKEAFMKTKNRVSGKIAVSLMEEETLHEIDEPSDFVIVEKLLEAKLNKAKLNPRKVKAMIFDVDGILTNGTVLTGNEKEIAKAFSLRDGMGLSLLQVNNIIPIVLTSENSSIVHTRMKKLGIEEYYPGVKDKFLKLHFILEKLNLSFNQIAYLGDDINDMANLNSVAWSFAPSDAFPAIANMVDVKLHNNGGDMAAREAIEFVIAYNKRFSL